jgi:hypothetical protein
MGNGDGVGNVRSAEETGKTLTDFPRKIYEEHGEYEETRLNIDSEEASEAEKIRNSLESYQTIPLARSVSSHAHVLQISVEAKYSISIASASLSKISL